MLQPDLFARSTRQKHPDLGQFFSPFWAAELLVERHFADLGTNDAVIEPSCGTGAFLAAIPRKVPAIGVEIDPVLAAQARATTGRAVIEGDFRTVPLDLVPTHIIGNPPFRMDVIDGFLERAYGLLPEGGRVGMIVPAYMFQTPSRVIRYADAWSLFQEMLPRTLFPGLSKPLVFAILSKDRQRTMVGFALYREAHDVDGLPEPYKKMLQTEGSVWKAAVASALRQMGGEATLQELYAALAPRRPTATVWWKEKIRQIARRHFTLTAPATYALGAASSQ